MVARVGPDLLSAELSTGVRACRRLSASAAFCAERTVCSSRAPPARDLIARVSEADRNVFYNAHKGNEVGFGSGKTFSTAQKSLTLDEWRQTYGFDRASVVADPGFVDPARRDYTLKPGSPALALGFTNIDQASIGLTADFPFSRD